MPEIEKLYSVVKDNGLYTKSYDEFVGKYSDEQNMSKLYQVVYDQGLYTKSFDDFKGKYFTQVKKKESASPSQQGQQATSSATGAMGPDGAPAPSARKRYDVKGKPAQPVAPAAPAAQLTAKDLEMMMPFRGSVQETTVIGDAPAVQENPFAQDVKRAGEILTKKSPEGDAFTAGIITEKPETKKYAKEVLAAVEGPTAPSYIEKIVNGSVAAGTLADEIAKLGRNDNIDEIDFERIASLNKLIQDNAIEDEGGVVGFLKNLPNVLASSIISMSAAYEAGAAGAATGAVTGSVILGLGAAPGAAAGYAGATSLALEYSSSLMGALRDAGVDITSEDQLKEAFSNPEKISEAKSYALKRGVPVAVFDAVSGGLAGKLFKTAAKATTKEVIKAGAKETAVQAALGGAGETTAQLIADGKLDARQIAYEMIAEPVSAIPPAAINYLGEKAKTAAEKKYIKRIETDANLKLKSDIATIVNPEIADSSKKINQYRKLKEEAVSQTAKDEYDKRIAEERDKKYSAYEKFFPVFDSLPDDKKQEAYDALDEVGQVKDEYNAAESPEEKKILGQVLAQKLNKLKTYAIQEQTTSEVPVQPGAAVSGEVAQGEPQAEPEVVTEEGQAKEKVTQYISDLQETKQSDPEQYWSVDSVTEEAAKEGTVISDEDGGVVVSKEGDIKGLFKKIGSKAKGVAQKLLQKAIDAGGIKLDNFDNYLTPIYEKAGFRVVSRVPFNEQYAPEGWNKEKHGTPDVVAMVYDPENKLDIQEQKFDDYDQAMAYRDQFIPQVQQQSEFDQAVNNSAQSLKMVAPDLKIIVAENTEDAQLQIAEALSAVAPTQAADVAEGFTTETRGQTVFVNGKPFAIVLDKSQADSKTVGHEAWETMLNDAFGDDQAKFKEFRDEIDRQLRLNGYGEIADALTKFSNQKGYEDVKYSEYMAELGGMLVANGFKKGSLDAKQKSLLEKIGDVINKFAQLFTGKKQFLDEATPEDILGFMVTISNKVAKGEDVSTFFREKNTQEIKDTKKVFSNRSQKIGDFDIQYFEDDAEFKDLVDRGLVVQNASIDEAGGQPVAIHQPDNLLVGNVNYKGKKIMEGNGGIYYVLKFGNVWASGKQTSAKTLSSYINKSRKESTDGIGRMVLVRGSQDKMISSVQGVKAAMRILEELVFDNLISTSDFRKALNAAGKSYNIDFSGSNSAKQIQKDIEDKFMNVSDSTFSDRGGFFSKLIDEIGKLESANKNIKEIRKALGTTKNIQFSREGIRKQIGTVLTERLLIGLDNSHAYAIVEVDEDVVVKKDDQHPSYPFSIVTKSGKPPVLKVFNYRPKAVEAITTMSGEKASNAQLGLAQMGMGMGRVASDKEIVVKSRSQKNVPTVVDEVLTDDGKGNYVFVHYSDELRDTIKPMSGSKKNFTSREEVSAISAVGGVAMYYTKQGQVESGVGNVPHTVLVPKDKVYFYGSTEKGTVSHDPEGFEEEARQRFQAYRNRGNEDRPTKYAFDANNSAAWVTKVAAENGYDMLVTNWGGPKSYRAQTTKALKPEAEYTGFKQIPEPTYEVGDEIFLYGRYATVVAVDGNTLSYESPNDFGRFDSGKFTLSPYTSNKIMLIEKAKPVITVRAQKKDTYTNQQYGEMSKNGVVFHGGTKSIDKLDPSKVKGGFRAVYGWGVYFAGTIYKASDYGDMITFLNSKALKFLKVNDEVTSGLISELGKIKDKNIYYDLFVDKLKNMVGTEINEARLRMGDFIRWDYNELWSQMFMDAGYDGFNQNDNEYVVFNIDKANQAILEDPLNVTTKSQKVVVNTIPGYERMMGEVEGILDKTMNRTGSYNQATANAVGYIQKSAVYERADDSQREQIVRDFVKLRGEKFKVAPSVGKILGQIKDTKRVAVNEKTALKDQIKLEAKAAKDAVAFVKQLRMQISNTLRGMAGRGVISAKQASTILARYDRMNILNPDMRDRFVDYMANVFQSAEYADKVKEATKLRKTIRKAAKNPDNQAESSKLAKTFAEIDPSRVENIDDYLNNAEQILKSVSRKTGDVKMRSLVNMTDMVSYIDKEIQAQREQIKNEILSKYQDLVDAGVLDSKMTINEIKKVVAAIEENEDESEAKAKEAKAAVKQMMDEVSPILLQIARTGEDPFTGDPIDLTQDEKSAIVKLAKMDLDNLSLAEAVKALEYANNFIANGVTSGIVGMVDLYEGSLNAEKLAKKGFKSIPFKKYFSKGAGRIWAEQIASLPMLNKLMWGSTSRALEVSEASGVTGVSNGKAKAIKIVEKAVKEYVATFSKVKGFLSSENVVERGMLAFVSRTVIGDEFQAQDEFNRRKSLIEETIQALKDPENSTDAEIKKGEVVEKVYNKILKDAKNANEVRANVSDINQSAVDWWVNEWSKHYDRMDEVSRNVYNTLLSRDSNFTPDRFQLKEVSPAAEEDFDSGFFGNFENVSTEKSGSLKENKRIKNLPQNKNGVKTRIVNLDFDVNNVNALTNAMVDVETAGSVMQMKGFVTSKDFSKLFASKEDKNVYKKRLVSYVNRAKGQGYVDQSELKTLNRLVNAVASFGTAKALFSLSQPFKQSIPPLFNTLVQTGRLDLGTLMVGGFSFIDRTGYPIANRGISSQGELKSINRQLVEAEKNLLLRGVDGVAAYSNLMLELTLKYPDIVTARSSWISFYKKGLKKEGIKTSGINWNTHEVNKKAADYAQMMVDSQQNISDSDMQGEFMASKDPAKAFLRRAIFPLMTFVLNQKTRIWADVRTLSNKAVTTAEDRQEAALSLAGALVELGAFSAISYAANSMLWEVAMNILAAVSGEDDDDDREEEKKKMILRRSAYTAQNFMKDFFVPPIPGADLLASKGINYILDETNLSSEIPADWFGIEDDRVKFRLYDKENQGYLDMLGTQGIALEKALELADYYDMAIDGTFKEESYGTKREKQILEGDADMARINAAIMTGYYGGLLPADVAYIVGQINKKIKKRAEVVEEED